MRLDGFLTATFLFPDRFAPVSQGFSLFLAGFETKNFKGVGSCNGTTHNKQIIIIKSLYWHVKYGCNEQCGLFSTEYV